MKNNQGSMDQRSGAMHQCHMQNLRTEGMDIATKAILRAQRRSQCKRMAAAEIAHQRTIEELDRVLLRQFKDWI